jgi:hypothetical protein
MRRALLILMSLLFLALGLGTTTGLFRFSVIGATEQGTRLLLLFLGALGLLYAAWRIRR